MGDAFLGDEHGAKKKAEAKPGPSWCIATMLQHIPANTSTSGLFLPTWRSML
jgi:hypothetical protein